MNRLFKAVAASAFAMLLAVMSNAARATDYADLWWNPTESGWGLMTSHQGDSIFITFYVFRADRSGTWFNALIKATTPGGPTYTGELYQASGPYYGGPFTPAATNRSVGNVTFTATSPTTANVSYSVDGVTVSKTVERFALESHNLAGVYIGSFLSVNHSCANPANNFRQFNGSGTFAIAHAPPAPTVVITATLSDNLVNFTCTYTGTYGQAGKIGSIVGTYTCSSGQSGTWNATEIEPSTLGGILGRYSATNAPLGCQITGGFGGLKQAL